MGVSSHSSTSHSLSSLFKNSPKLFSILFFSWVSATSLDIYLSWIRDLWLDPCGGSSPVIFTSHGHFSQQGKRMHSASPIKQKFLKKWIMGLQLCNSSKKNMTITERRKAIKLSADLALASVRSCTTRWSRALIASASQNDDNKALLQHIIGSDAAKLKKASLDAVANSPTSLAKKIASKKILKRSWGIRRVRKLSNGVPKDRPNSIAKRLVKKRTQLLKNLVPGGESMDAISLIEETLDYMVWLRAQVDVMRSLARASELLDGK